MVCAGTVSDSLDNFETIRWLSRNQGSLLKWKMGFNSGTVLTLLVADCIDIGDNVPCDTALVSHRDSSSKRGTFDSFTGSGSSVISSGVDGGSETHLGLVPDILTEGGGIGTCASAHGPSKQEQVLPIGLSTI